MFNDFVGGWWRPSRVEVIVAVFGFQSSGISATTKVVSRLRLRFVSSFDPRFITLKIGSFV